MRTTPNKLIRRTAGHSDATNEHQAFFALFRGILEAAPDPTIVVDADGKIIFCNPAVERELGYSPQQLVGKQIDCLLPERLRASHLANRIRYAAEPSIRAMGAGRKLVALRADGAEIPVEISLNPIPSEQGLRIACVVRDISARLRAEQALQDLNATLEQKVAARTAELQALNGELEMLSYSIAHDLRAPLRAIHGFATRLRAALPETAEDPKLRCVDGIASRVTRIGCMLDDYLKLLRIGSQPLALETIDARVLVKDVVHDLTGNASGKIDIADLPVVVADSGLLREAFRQLLDNAIKFSAGGAPQIRVTARADDTAVHFTICDNGVGFDPAYAGKLFRLFERLHGAEYPGNGIGLCATKRIVERHGGGVGIVGRLNAGARVTFWLPTNLRNVGPV
jgi:PAS domain S-box-containing protein